MATKYIIQKAKEQLNVVKINAEEASILEFPYISWTLKGNEKLYKILEPATLKNQMWYSFAVYDSEDEAKLNCK